MRSMLIGVMLLVSRDYRKHGISVSCHPPQGRAARTASCHQKRASWPADIFECARGSTFTLKGLKVAEGAHSRGMTAKSVYFGKVDFGAGAAPAENLLLLSFVHEGRGWKYDTAEFINLDNLKDVRAQLASGDLSLCR